jgi:hypothetical protein
MPVENLFRVLRMEDLILFSLIEAAVVVAEDRVLRVDDAKRMINVFPRYNA